MILLLIKVGIIFFKCYYKKLDVFIDYATIEVSKLHKTDMFVRISNSGTQI